MFSVDHEARTNAFNAQQAPKRCTDVATYCHIALVADRNQFRPFERLPLIGRKEADPPSKQRAVAGLPTRALAHSTDP